MYAASTPTATERLLGLLLITGAMMVVSAVPVGSVVLLLEHVKFGMDWRSSIAEGAVIAIAIAAVGCGLFGSARFVLLRR